jgi:hypothetical protein
MDDYPPKEKAHLFLTPQRAAAQMTKENDNG